MRSFLVTIGAASLLIIMSVLLIGSSWNDAAIFDETAHIGAAYSYISQKDMRLNPEHPPLMKDLAGLAISLVHPVFRTDTPGWQNEINGQWSQGGAFLYEFGNDADQIIRFGRFPIILLTLIFGWIFFRWVQKRYGNPIALLTLFFYAFSPTIIAHGRFVTTDIAAMFAFFIGIISYVQFLEDQSRKRLIIAGIAFGVAQLLKFSLFLLVPIDAVLGLIWLWSDQMLVGLTKSERTKKFFSNLWPLVLKTFFIFVIGALLVWTFYIWHVWNYPQERQYHDAQTLIGTFRVKPLVSLDLWLISHRPFRALGQYLLGLMMVTQRTAGGNSAYFLGEVSANGWWYYFPLTYLLKEPLGLHLLTLLATCLAIGRLTVARRTREGLRAWVRQDFALTASIFFVAFYWASSISNPLNIGVRHVLPTFPFIYLLVARQLVLWITGAPRAWDGSFGTFAHNLLLPLPKFFLVSIACTWIALSTILTFPYYLSYFNALAGGTYNGYKYITDSNYDWGQDLKRLVTYAKIHPQETIYLDYFGGGSPKYYLGNQYKAWYSSYGPPPPGSLFAVSANSIQGNQAHYVGKLSIKPEDTYSWLRDLKPFSRAGTSIFLYRIP